MNTYSVLTVIGGIIGIIVTGAAVYTIWSVAEARKNRGKAGGGEVGREAGDALRRWTVMDYAALALFATGALLMSADLMAVMRDRESYPYYHYGYLFSAFIFMFVGMMFMAARLAVVLGSGNDKTPDKAEGVSTPKAQSSLHNDHGQPYQADESH